MSALKAKLKPTRFPDMSPLMAAIVGYVLGVSYTTPEINEITVEESDNLVYIRKSGADYDRTKLWVRTEKLAYTHA